MGCHTSKPKKELIRIVKVAQKLIGESKQVSPVCVDNTGKLAGRGAYICPDVQCLKLLKKARRLEKEFEMAIDDEIYNLLEISIEGIGKEVNGG